MTLQARYSGTCPECGDRWQPGDLIRSQAVGAERHEFWMHAVCPDDDPLDSPHPVCPSCWLTHPEGACDR